jgi:hypothetical protein
LALGLGHEERAVFIEAERDRVKHFWLLCKDTDHVPIGHSWRPEQNRSGQ